MDITGIPRSKKITGQASKSDYKFQSTIPRRTLIETRVTKTIHNVQFSSKTTQRNSTLWSILRKKGGVNQYWSWVPSTLGLAYKEFKAAILTTLQTFKKKTFKELIEIMKKLKGKITEIKNSTEGGY